MRNSLIIAFCAFLATAFRPAADRLPLAIRYNIEQGSQLSIQGTTNVNTFECFSRQGFGQQTLRVILDPAGEQIEFDNAILNLRVRELNCDNSKINADLCDALNAEQFPNIIIELHDARIERGSISDEWTDIRISASLTITNQKRRIEIRARGKAQQDGRYRFMAQKALKMSDYGVDPPTALFGLIKVKDDITINFNLLTRVAIGG